MSRTERTNEEYTDVLVVGGGVGGVAAALAACEGGARVVVIEPYAWIGGQLTSQAVPPDEHRWIETHGSTASYRRFRQGVRSYYQDWYALAPAQGGGLLNPGNGWVSALCHEPRAALAVLRAMLAPGALPAGWSCTPRPPCSARRPTATP